MLEPLEQQLFLRLAVFSGGLDVEAAESICGDGVDVVDGLASLAESGLISGRGCGRRAALCDAGDDPRIRRGAARGVRRRGRASAAPRRLLPGRSRRRRSRTSRGSPGDGSTGRRPSTTTFEQRLDRLEASDENERGLRLAGALWRFWYLKGHLAEGRRRLESALLADERPTAARAKALNGAAVMAVNMGDSATAKLRAEEGRALHRTLGDRWGAAYAGFMLGNSPHDGRRRKGCTSAVRGERASLS